MRRLPTVYLALVAAVAVSRAVTGHPTAHSWGLTPDQLAIGQVWLLATSALIVNGTVVPQIAALALTIVVALRLTGGRWTATVMVVAHVGATLLAYATLLAATGEADGVHEHTNDYGTSAVFLGLLGAVAAASVRAAFGGSRRARSVLAAAVATLIGAVALFPLMTATEHAFAFVLGAGLGALRERRLHAGRSARSAATTASAPAAVA